MYGSSLVVRNVLFPLWNLFATYISIQAFSENIKTFSRSNKSEKGLEKIVECYTYLKNKMVHTWQGATKYELYYSVGKELRFYANNTKTSEKVFIDTIFFKKCNII